VTTLSKGRAAQVDLLRRIEAAGGWEQVVDMVADGQTLRQIAEVYGTERVQLRRLMREYVDTRVLNEAVYDGVDGMVEDAREAMDLASPETAQLRHSQFNMALKLAGFLHKDKFGETKTAVQVNLSIADLHLQAVKQVNAEQRAPIEGTFRQVATPEEPDGHHLLR
jgi:hypothetical protein